VFIDIGFYRFVGVLGTGFLEFVVGGFEGFGVEELVVE
jgi:hypothetical protein